MKIPPIALTLGDPAGVGPELSLKANEVIGAEVPFFLVADATKMKARFGEGSIEIIEDCASFQHSEKLSVFHFKYAQPYTPRIPHPENAASTVAALDFSVELVKSGQASALCTNPISKAELARNAGFAFPGHTEFLAAKTGTKTPVMMIASDALNVVPVTIHVALSEVPTLLTKELLRDTIRIVLSDFKTRFGTPSPRLMLTGLNPHAGENGLMGHEDAEIITPVIEEFQQKGFDLKGPLPADTAFTKTMRDSYDVAICMYHDQALIPVKTLAFDQGVNVTLGLPIIRTSPDHGTAFDIAGDGKAHPESLIAALKLAYKMAGLS